MVFIRNQDSVLFNKSSSMNLFIRLNPTLYQVMLVEASIMLSPCHPEIGTKATAAGL